MAQYAQVSESGAGGPKPVCSSCQALVNWARSPRSIGEREQIVWHQTPANLTASMKDCPFCEFIGSRVIPSFFETIDKIYFVLELRRTTPNATMVDCLADGEFEEDKKYYPYTNWFRTNCRSTDVGKNHQRAIVSRHPQTHSSSFWLVADDGKSPPQTHPDEPISQKAESDPRVQAPW